MDEEERNGTKIARKALDKFLHVPFKKRFSKERKIVYHRRRSDIYFTRACLASRLV